jgi:hypothetical protein
MFAPSVALEPPVGWADASAEIAQPPIAAGSGATLTQWRVSRSPANEVLVGACVATPIPGWVEDLRPSVVARTTAFTAAAAERVIGVPIELREARGAQSAERAEELAGGVAGGAPDREADRRFLVLPAGAPESGPRLGSARTFLGFGEGSVVTCFVLCASRGAAPEPPPSRARACDSSVLGARLEGDAAPPPPGAGLRGVTWAVHNPRSAAAWAGAIVAALGVLAVVSRRRPRSRI